MEHILIGSQVQQMQGGGAGGILFLIVWLGIIVALIAGNWKMFAKAGKPGWACLIPIYGQIVLAEIAGKPGWWGLLLFVPIVQIVVGIIIVNEISKAFGYGIGMLLALIFVPFIAVPVIGFGSAEYQGA